MRWFYISLLASLVCTISLPAEAQNLRSLKSSQYTSTTTKKSPAPEKSVATISTTTKTSEWAPKPSQRTTGTTLASTNAAPNVKLRSSLASNPRLATAQASFSSQSQKWRVVKQPTTSGWTWLFLFWALHESSQREHLKNDVASIQQEMTELEGKLQQSPEEWSNIQEIKQGIIASSSMVTTSSIEDETPLNMNAPNPLAEVKTEEVYTSAPQQSNGFVASTMGLQYDDRTPFGQVASTVDSILWPMFLLMFCVLFIKLALRYVREMS